jgi:hypothetical protein
MEAMGWGVSSGEGFAGEGETGPEGVPRALFFKRVRRAVPALNLNFAVRLTRNIQEPVSRGGAESAEQRFALSGRRSKRDVFGTGKSSPAESPCASRLREKLSCNVSD